MDEQRRIPAEFQSELHEAQNAESLYLENGHLAQLNLAVATWHRILDHAGFATSPPHFRLLVWNESGRVFLRSYWAQSRIEDLEMATRSLESAAALVPSDSRNRVAILNSLGNALRTRYIHHGKIEDLEAAIEAWGEAGSTATPGSRAWSMCLNNLGNGLSDLYAYRGQPEDLEAAIRAFQSVVSATPPDSPDRPMFLTNLGNSLNERYVQSGRAEDLDAAIAVYVESVSSTPPDSPDWPSRLNNLGTGLRDRYAHKGQRDDLYTAIRSFELAVMATPADAVESPLFLSNLANGLGDRYDLEGRREDLDAAINAYQEAVARTAANSPDLPWRLTGLSLGLHDRYVLTGQFIDLQDAVDVSERALAVTPLDASGRPILLNNLARCLYSRYRHAGAIKDLEEAIGAYETAVAATPANSPDLPSRLANLGTGLRERYLIAGQPEDLDAAIDAYRAATTAMPSASIERAAVLNNLAAVLRERYARGGLLNDLESAISAWQEVLALTPPNAPDRPTFLNNLSAGLQARYEYSGRLDDLDAAIQAGTEAVGTSPADSPDRPSRLNNLATGLRARYRRRGELNDLDPAVDAWRAAVEATAPDSPNYPMYLNNLGTGLRERYALGGSVEDLAEAIRVSELAVAASVPGSPNRAMFLDNLGTGLYSRYLQTRQPADRVSGIDAWQAAVESTPADSPMRPGYLNNLATGLRSLYAETGQPDDLGVVIQHYEATCRQGLAVAVEVALHAARNWGAWALGRRSWSEAAQAYGYGMEAVERLFRVQLLRTSKETWLRESQGLPGRAAYVLARCGRLEEAAITLEQGRARLLTEVLARDHSELSALQSAHPGLWNSYRQAAARLAYLESGELRPESLPAEFDLTAEVRTARADLDATVEEIRGLAGYEAFLAVPGMDAITEGIQPDDAVVYLVVTSAGSLGLVVRANAGSDYADLSVTFLDEFLESDLDGLLAAGAYLDGMMQATGLRTELGQTLRILGERVVGPVADRLRVLQVRRLVLVPVGRLGLLPLHAAAYAVDGAPRCLLDEFEVAYVPSIQVLRHCQAALESSRLAKTSLFAVGNPLPLPDGVSPLTFAGIEAGEVAVLFGEDVQLAYEVDATRASVEAAMAEARYLHLACHGQFKADEPLASGLILSGGEELTLARILSQRRLTGSRLAVLSACQTAITDFANLPDEVIGLPAGFLQAGVPGVVGTLWPVDDLSTMLLMVRFYRYHLREDEATGEGPMAPVGALRRAQLWLQDVTCGELTEVFDGLRQGARGGTRMTYELAQEQFRKYALSGEASERPFAHPYYWAPFVFYGC